MVRATGLSGCTARVAVGFCVVVIICEWLYLLFYGPLLHCTVKTDKYFGALTTSVVLY